MRIRELDPDRDLGARQLPDALRGKRMGLMGGTFDPIHVGHLILAEAAREELSLDGVLFMPTGLSYLKEGRKVSDREDRFRMTALAIRDNPFFYISRLEVDRPGNTHTADTLRELRRRYDGCEWFLLMGADSYLMLDLWVEPEVICRLSTLVCAVRGEAAVGVLEEQRAKLARLYGARSEILALERMDISSSEIRAGIAAGRSMKYFLRDEVLEYIRAHGSYRREQD